MATIPEALALAHAHYSAGRLDLADAVCAQVLAVTVDAEALHLRGVIAWSSGDRTRGEQLIRQSLELTPYHAPYYANLGHLYRQAGELAAAVENFRLATEFDPLSAAAHCDLGTALKDQGELDEAVLCYRQALALDPDHAPALNNLGNTLKRQGKLAEAAACYRRVLELHPQLVAAWNNLGNTCRELRQFDEALECFCQASQLEPDNPLTVNNQGNVYLDQREFEQAVSCFRRTVELAPQFAPGHYNLANAHQEQKRWAEAEASYRQALSLDPKYAEAWNNLGGTLREVGRLEEAAAAYRQALQLRPRHAESHNNLGNVHHEQGNLAEAAGAYRQAIQLLPEFAQAHINLGNVLKEQGELDQAVACLHEALRLDEDSAEAWNNLANVYKERGEIEEALAGYRRSLKLNPADAEVHSNLVFGMLFSSKYDRAALDAELRNWNATHAAPLAGKARPHTNERSPDRRLRVGYVSPDLRQHPVGQFMLPLLEAHDHETLEIYCYAGVPQADWVTRRCQTLSDHWRVTCGLSDADLAEQIRADRIDILVDLSQHTARHRLLMFAHRPAPLQVAYLAYAGATGLAAMDYRLTDPHLDPPGVPESTDWEKPWRLPETFWCYQPWPETPPVSNTPALRTGHVTFGCLNQFAKVTPETLSVWCELLRQCPGSHLLLHAQAGSHHDRVRQLLSNHGVSPERLKFVGRMPTQEYFNTFHQIDLALDPFPYGGGTTTCDALWMGVPVVSLAGELPSSRAGLSLLSQVGLGDLVANDAEAYVNTALELASDFWRLQSLRASLRERMQTSPLMDAPRFARNVEAAYRQMWHAWCTSR